MDDARGKTRGAAFPARMAFNLFHRNVKRSVVRGLLLYFLKSNLTPRIAAHWTKKLTCDTDCEINEFFQVNLEIELLFAIWIVVYLSYSLEI